MSDVYFLLRVRIIFGDVFLFIPNIGKFLFVRKKNLKDKQTNRQTTFHTRLSSENGNIIKKKEIQSGGTQLKVN